MVLQRELENPIWGTAHPGDTIEISIAGKTVSTRANKDGNWRTKIAALPAGGPHTLRVSGKNEVQIKDVLVGEVWMCSGQSNMAWTVNNSNRAEVEIASANFPEIRMITVQKNGTQIPQNNIEGEWTVCSPKTVGDFSAVGYFYGRRLHTALEVPIGLINNAWGGSSAEAWVPRDTLEADGSYHDMLNYWDKRIAEFDQEKHQAYIQKYEQWIAKGRLAPRMRAPSSLDDPRGRKRPANIYNGMVYPTQGYGMKGVIWYQGESNADRAAQHLQLFPLLVKTWRERWQQGNFPFYWVQLADFGMETDKPGDDSWAEFRDSQTSSLDVIPNSGQAVIIDLGEGRDIHPRNKQSVADRLVRWPLVNDYGFEMASQSPRYKSMTVNGSKVRITLEYVSSGGLWSFDTKEIVGFSIAGKDQKFVWAQARILDKNTIEVWSDELSEPVAVRYGWSKNPRVNLYDRNGLPVTPFRTDEWEWLSEGKTY